MATLKNTTINDTGFLRVPNGTTGERPSGVTGMIRYNTSTAGLEVYTSNGTKWVNVAGPAYTVDALIVAGGGSGGANIGGGGGAGGFRAITGITVYPGYEYPIIVGGGGTANGGQNRPSANWLVTGSNGADSSAFGYTSIGGGAGGYANRDQTAYLGYNTGRNGGSGGGGGNVGSGPTIAGGTGTAGQGNNGGNCTVGGYNGGRGGGGGGAGAAGANNGPGGNGSSSAIAQSSPTYAGGGGGSFYQNNNGSPGGSGGGGQGGPNTTDASVNTGSGGGGGTTYIGKGGSGIVWVRYTGAQKGIGGTVTNDGTYTYHKFTGSEVFRA
jgi:hypothetical protein